MSFSQRDMLLSGFDLCALLGAALLMDVGPVCALALCGVVGCDLPGCLSLANCCTDLSKISAFSKHDKALVA